MKWYSHNWSSWIVVTILLFMAPPPFTAADAPITLEKCIVAARRHHPSMDAARAASLESRTQIDAARAQFGPNLDLSAAGRFVSTVPEIIIGGNSVDTPLGPITIPGSSRKLGDYDSYSIDLKIQQIIYAGGIRKGNVTRAELAAEIAALAEPVKRLELDRRVAMTYLALLQSRELEESAENTLTLAREHRDNVRNLLESGVVLENELMKAELRVSEAENRLITTQNGTAVQVERLQILTGLKCTAEEAAPLPPSRTTGPEPSRPDALALAFARRPELAVYDVGIERMEHEIEMIRRERLPTVSAFGQASYGKPGPDFPQNDWIDSYQAGIQLNVNLWDYGRRESRMAQPAAAVMRLRSEKKTVMAAVEQAVVESIIAIRDASARLEVTGRAVGQATTNFRLTAHRFEEGTVTNTDFLDAEIALANAKNQHIIARTGLETAYVNYLLTIGTDLVPED